MKTLAALDARVKLACLIIFVIASLHARSAPAVIVCVAVAAMLSWAVRLTGRDVRAVLLPLVPILVITVIMQVLYFQQGPALATIGPVTVTTEALGTSARMLASLLAIMLASLAFMRCTTTEELMRMLRWLLAPLRVMGMRTDAFMLSLSIAFRFVPVLVGEFQLIKRAQMARCGNFDGKVRDRLGAYTRLFAPLVRSSFNRADMLAEAFLARCFSCEPAPTSLYDGHFGMRDLAFFAGAIAISVVVIVLG